MNALVKKAADLALQFGQIVEREQMRAILETKGGAVKFEPKDSFFLQAISLRDAVNQAFQAIPPQNWQTENRAIELSGAYLWQNYRIVERSIENVNLHLAPHGQSVQKLTPIALG